MCTAVTYNAKNHYFGRNLDLEYSYNETVTITPRNYKFKFTQVDSIESHYAIIGMAYVNLNYPLYYDAVNEAGLGMAGLSFRNNAHYYEADDAKDNIATFEFIPWILSQCKDVKEAREKLNNINLTDKSFSPMLVAQPMHWMIADSECSIVVECMKDGMKIYDNPVGVLTNNPPFDYQMFNLNNYMKLSAKYPDNSFLENVQLDTYSHGMGALGLPGDLSSASRFVKAVYTKEKSICDGDEMQSVNQFFHILTSVEQQRGCVCVGDKYEITVYSACCNLDEGIYYYRTYDNSQICAVNMHRENLDGKELISYKLYEKTEVKWHN